MPRHGLKNPSLLLPSSLLTARHRAAENCCNCAEVNREKVGSSSRRPSEHIRSGCIQLSRVALKIRCPHCRVGQQFSTAPLKCNLSMLEYVPSMRNAQRVVSVLFNQQNRHAEPLVQLPDNRKNLLDEDR